MAKKKKNKGIKKLVKQAGPNISEKEFKQIAKAAGGNVRKALNRISNVGANLSSGAANMLIKQQQKAPAMRYDPKGPFGTSKIGQALQQMAGSPARIGPRNPQSGAPSYNIPGTAPQMMIGGTVIRPGGKVAVKKRPKRTFDTTEYDQTITDLTNRINDLETAGNGDGDGLGIQDILDALGSFEMPDYGDMFSGLENSLVGMYDELSSQFDTPDPIQLAALGQAYGGDLIRARQRQHQRKTRSDYLRNQMNNMALGGLGGGLAPMMIGGGLAL